MPGIESDRASGIQIGPIASIGTEVQPTPAIGDLMDAFKQGFITVDDLKKRAQQERLGNDAEKTQLQASDFQRRLAPGAFENAQMAQGLQANQIVAAGQVLPSATQATIGANEVALGTQAATKQEQGLEADENSGDPARIERAKNHRAEYNFSQLNGHPAPSYFEVDFAPEDKPVPDDFKTWFEKKNGDKIQKQIDNFRPGENTTEANVARAKYANDLEAQQLQEGSPARQQYAHYVSEQNNLKSRLSKGTPEYTAELIRRNQVSSEKLGVQAAKIKALPTVIEQTAKAAAEAPGKEKQAAALLQKEYGTRQEIQDLRKVQAAYYKIDRVLDTSVPPSASRDQAAIFSFMKILDPGSTVREGEYATVKNSRGVPERISAWYNQVLTGQILTPPQRNGLKEAVTPVYLGQVQAAAPTIKQFLSQEGANVGDIVPPEDVNLLKMLTPSPSQGGAAGAKPPSAGAQRVVQNGVTFQWDGNQYVPVQ